MLGLLFAAPLLTRGHGYVIGQYTDWIKKLPVSSRPEGLYEDLRGLVTTLGWTLPDATYFALRTLAALGVLGLSTRVFRRFSEVDRAVLIGALSAAYIMLFNPRTQSNSYVIVAPFAALMALRFLFADLHRAAVATGLVVLGWYGNSHWMRFPEFWLKPLVCVVFFAVLSWVALTVPPLSGASTMAPPGEQAPPPALPS